MVINQRGKKSFSMKGTKFLSLPSSVPWWILLEMQDIISARYSEWASENRQLIGINQTGREGYEYKVLCILEINEFH